MKKIKVSLLGVVAIALGICAMGFATPIKKSSKKLQNHNYRYQLSDNSGMTNPANYVLTTDLSGCDDGNVICIIEAPGTGITGSQPSFPNGTNPYSNTQGVSVLSEKP